MLYKQLIELFDILDSPKASGAQVVEYLNSIMPGCKAETYPLEGPKGHTDMVRIMIPGKNGKTNGPHDRYSGTSGRSGSASGAARIRIGRGRRDYGSGCGCQAS